jgi:N-acetylmuramate 1-kinase
MFNNDIRKIESLLQNPVLQNAIESRIGKVLSAVEISGGSDRRYWRVCGDNGQTVVVLHDQNIDRLNRFIDATEYLISANIPAQKILSVIPEIDCLLLEDIGDNELRKAIKAGVCDKSIYYRIVDLLVEIQTAPNHINAPDRIATTRFDLARLRNESGQFLTHLVHEFLEINLDDYAHITPILETIAQEIDRMPKTLMHRDFQSSNIYIKEDSLKIIDYQDLCFGPYLYDLASLLEDPYVELDDDFKGNLKNYYYEKIFNIGFCTGYPTFERDYILCAISRLMQAVGAYARLTMGGKTSFAQYIKPGLLRLYVLCLEYNSTSSCDFLLVIADKLEKKGNRS